MQDHDTSEVKMVLLRLAVAFIRLIMLLYDVITIPAYTILQQPWSHWKFKNVKYAVSTSGAVAGPYSRVVHRVDEHRFAGLKTIDQLMRRSIERFPHEKCFGWREVFGEQQEQQADGKMYKKTLLGEYKWLTYGEVGRKLDLISGGLLSVGVRPRQNICIFAETRVEWMLAAQACFRINVPIVTLYSTLSEEAVIYGLNQTKASHVITSHTLVNNIIRWLPRLPHITHIIYMENPIPTSSNPAMVDTKDENVQCFPFRQLETLGRTHSNLKGEIPGADDTAILMYTSGSTGVPKAVVICHSNIIATCRGFSTALYCLTSADSYISYLPLAHVYEISSQCTSIAYGAHVAFSSPQTLTDKSTGVLTGCRGDLQLARPALLTAVPLVLDRVRKAITEQVASKGKLFEMFFNHALKYKTAWLNMGYNTPLLDRLVFNKTKQILGGQVQVMAIGSAQISSETHSFTRAIMCCHTIIGYGLTETAAGATLQENCDLSLGRMGPPLVGVKIKLIDWPEGGYLTSDQPLPRGEISVGGDTVAKGYYSNEQLTRATFEEYDGVRWVRTGDIGQVHLNGTVEIVDRKKDLFKGPSGEYVALGKVEAELKTCPLVENICVCGNSLHTKLVALVVPSEEFLLKMAQSVPGKSQFPLVELYNDHEMVQAATNDITCHARKCDLRNADVPVMYKLCLPWTPDSGLVTASLKIRRNELMAHYKEDIRRMYSEIGAN